jgi:two-component system, OmpR family, sensor histidine kinase CpxA
VIARLRRSLGARILLLAGLNLAVLVAIGLAASGVRVPRSVPQAVMQSADARLQDVARRIALDLERATPEEADPILQRYAVEYRTRFVLVRNDGTRLAGEALAIPDAVRQALSGPPPQGQGREPRFLPFGGAPPPAHGRSLPPVGPPVGPPDARTGLRMPQTPAHLVPVHTGPRFWIVLRLPIRFAGATDITPGSLLVVPYGFFTDPLLFPLRTMLWVLLGLSITVLCWWPVLRSITRSLARMEHATSEIAQGKFDTKIGVSRPDEIGRLSSSIEQMAGRLGVMVSGQKRFLGDTAHELRSPIGRMQIALEILENKVADPERAYVGDLKEDVEALRKLTDELLQYARAELRERGRLLESVPLLPLVEKVIVRDGSGATITSTIDARTVVSADPGLLERALSNVVRNAATYAGAAGPIHINAAEDAGQVVISIADQGPGVSPESLQRLFEPFYREDEARNRKTGGVGLGLAIVRSAVEACGGSVSCHLRAPHGLEVRIVLQSAR